MMKENQIKNKRLEKITKWINRVKITLLWLAVIIDAILIFYLSSLNVTPAPPGEGLLTTLKIPADKVAHFGLFAVFALILFFAVHYTMLKKTLLNKILITYTSGIFYGLLDEIHQYYVPPRTTSVEDLIGNIIGVITGIVVGYFVYQRITPKVL